MRRSAVFVILDPPVICSPWVGRPQASIAPIMWLEFRVRFVQGFQHVHDYGADHMSRCLPVRRNLFRRTRFLYLHERCVYTTKNIEHYVADLLRDLRVFYHSNSQSPTSSSSRTTFPVSALRSSSHRPKSDQPSPSTPRLRS